MKFYKPTIIFGVLGIVIANLILKFEMATLLEIFFVFVLVLIPTGLFTMFTRIIPASFLNPQNYFFKARKFEKGFYEKIKIKKWKNLVPELGDLVHFKKNKFTSSENKEYLEKFIDESCRGELVHSFSFIWGFLALSFINMPQKLTIGLPLAIIHGFLHILPVFIQRYIRPKIYFIYQKKFPTYNQFENKEKVEQGNFD